jgi:hypothetical protein
MVVTDDEAQLPRSTVEWYEALGDASFEQGSCTSGNVSKDACSVIRVGGSGEKLSRVR